RVVVDLGVEEGAALVWAAGAVVLDPVAGEGVDAPVGELHRDLDGDLAVGLPEDGAQIVGKRQALHRALEVVTDDVEVRRLRPLAGLREPPPPPPQDPPESGGPRTYNRSTLGP